MSYLDDALDMISYDPLGIEDKAQAELAALRAENEKLKDVAGNAFVEGAKWWEFESTKGTMWGSDQERAAHEAVARKMPFKPVLETVLENHIKMLADLLDECASEIEAHVKAEYHYPDVHPCQRNKY